MLNKDEFMYQVGDIVHTSNGVGEIINKFADGPESREYFSIRLINHGGNLVLSADSDTLQNWDRELDTVKTLREKWLSAELVRTRQALCELYDATKEFDSVVTIHLKKDCYILKELLHQRDCAIERLIDENKMLSNKNHNLRKRHRELIDELKRAIGYDK